MKHSPTPPLAQDVDSGHMRLKSAHAPPTVLGALGLLRDRLLRVSQWGGARRLRNRRPPSLLPLRSTPWCLSPWGI